MACPLPSAARPKVLVLGSKSTGKFLASALHAQGLDPVFLQGALPSPFGGTGAQDLKAILDAQPDDIDFLHPGSTLWAERPELPVLCVEAGITAICPASRVLSFFSNRLSLLDQARREGIPNLALSQEPLCSIREIHRFIDEQSPSFPFVLKSTRGEAGLTIFVAMSRGELDKRLPLWLEQLRKTVGEVMVFPERYLDSSRYVSIPFARLVDDTVETFPSVDISLQSGFRKLVGFCPATGIDAEVEKRLREWTVTMARSCHYVGVGALEYLVDGLDAYLMSGSARLNTEFHLWERVGGASAVAWQWAALQGADREDAPERSAGPDWKTGLVLRIYAEDPLLNLPQPGVVVEASAERHWKLEFDKGSAEGELVLGVDVGEEVFAADETLDHGLVGSLWVGASDRKLLVGAARKILEEVWIAGSLQTNERFLHELLSHSFIREGLFHTGFVNEEFLPPLRPPVELIRVFAAICQKNFPEAPAPTGALVRFSVGNVMVQQPDLAEFRWREGPVVAASGAVSGVVLLPSEGALRVHAYPIHENRWQVRIGLWVQTVKRHFTQASRVERKKTHKLFALVPGVVHSTLFREGATVPAHESMAIIESLRMLVPHAIPVNARLLKWGVSAEQVVRAGDELAEFEILE